MRTTRMYHRALARMRTYRVRLAPTRLAGVGNDPLAQDALAPVAGRARRALVAVTIALVTLGALSSEPAMARQRGHKPKANACKKVRAKRNCGRRVSKGKQPAGLPTAPASGGPSAPAPPSPPAPGGSAPGGGPGSGSGAGGGAGTGTGGASAAAQFASGLAGTTYERYTSSSSGSDFTDDYTFCSNNTFLEHTESYAGGYVVNDYTGTWNVTNAISSTVADLAYRTTNPYLPSTGTVRVTLVPNGLYIGSNGYYRKRAASC